MLFRSNFENVTTSVAVTVLPLAPVVSSQSLKTVARTGVVTVAGENLAGASVKIGSVAATISQSSTDTTLIFTVPATAVLGVNQVTVATSGGSATAEAITVVATPTITSITPTSAMRGATVAVVGTNLLTATATIGGEAVSLTSATATGFSFVVPKTLNVGATSLAVLVAGVTLNKSVKIGRAHV